MKFLKEKFDKNFDIILFIGVALFLWYGTGFTHADVEKDNREIIEQMDKENRW